MPMSFRLVRLLFAGAFLVGAARTSPAQPAAPVLTITVVDQTDALVGGATVVVTQPGGEPQVVRTQGDGAARVTLAGPSRVDVRVEAAGFRAGTIGGLQVRRDTRRTVKLVLALEEG